MPEDDLQNDAAEGQPSAGSPARSRGRRPHKDAPAEAEARPPAGDDGKLSFDPGIITQIAVTEARRIEGIVELTGSFMDDWVLRRGHGVRVEEPGGEGAGGYTLDLKISVEYGVDCVRLAREVRARIAGAIKKMTGQDTRAINIHVTTIGRKEDRAAEHREESPAEEGTGIDF
jgi:uncharacterized alkaline shock family protein YloU